MPYHGRASVPVTQTKNDVGGHMGGRDVNVYANAGDVYLTAPADPVRHLSASVFRRLFERLAQEANEDKVLTGYIRQLEIYTRVVENEQVVGLEEKLRMAGRDRQLPLAAGLKENIFATLKANLFSPTYQMIAATLMAKVHERFETYVRPLIEDGADAAAIDKAVSQHITMPFAEELEACPQFEEVAVDYVRGMIYFLTGNCHIRWDKC